ncbi:unnamed protein product [Moneuplotes crassus]|uniref:Uncharacterized protein n=1 Tax=Euplotes crassus TaxID=5936 RepID=A0AAD1Y6N2_EUPCR|nr:unnamed protein product [Moneuplotes crassus]
MDYCTKAAKNRDNKKEHKAILDVPENMIKGIQTKSHNFRVIDKISSIPKSSKKKKKAPQDEESKNKSILHFYEKSQKELPVRREVKKIGSTSNVGKKSIVAPDPPKKRKRKPLFDKKKTRNPIKKSIRKKPKYEEFEIYSQSSQTNRSFSKECTSAFYVGPPEQYAKKTKDFQEQISLHELEFEKADQEEKERNRPKYYILPDKIQQKLSPLKDSLTKIYCEGVEFDDKETLQTFINTELVRISIIFFNSIKGVRVDFTSDPDLKRNCSQDGLLIDKYNENYMKDLIDNSKNSVKAYLYNYLHSLNIQGYMDEIANKDEDWSSFLAGNTDYSQATRSSSRLKTKKVERIHAMNKQYSGVFFNNECFDYDDLLSEKNIAIGNSATQVIKTCCEDLGFKVTFINGLSMKRNSTNLTKYIKEKTQSSRILFQPTEEEEKNSKTAIVFQDVDNAFPDEIGFLAGVIKCIEHSKIPIFITSHCKFHDCEIIKRCDKKGLKIKNIKMVKDHIPATKIAIRFHLIILFEVFIKKSLTDYLDKHGIEGEKKDINFDIDCLKLYEGGIFHIDFLKNHQEYILQLLQKHKFDLKRSLALVDLHTFQKACESLDLQNDSIFEYCSRKDLFWNNSLYSTSTPARQLCTLYFQNTLDQVISHSDGDAVATDTSKGSPEVKQQEACSDSLENYAKFLQDQAELDFFHGRQSLKEENISTRNICDANLTQIGVSQGCENDLLLEEFWLGAVTKKPLSSDNQKRRKFRKSAPMYEKFLKPTPTHNGSRMTMDRLGDNNEQIPYFCYPSKEGALEKYKKMLTSTASLYGCLEETQRMSQLSLELNLRSSLT